jgi:hypothetical protein
MCKLNHTFLHLMKKRRIVKLMLIEFIFFSIFFFFQLPIQAQSPSTYYVSPNGNDSNSGTLDEPFKTIKKARDVVRTQNQTMTNDIVIYLRDGIHQLEQTLTLTSQDSGTNGFYIIYKAYPNETPIISGGKKITGWIQDGNKWKAAVGTLSTRQLFVNGKRAIRARSTQGLPGVQKRFNGYTTTDTSMAYWKNKDAIELVDQNGAKLFRCPIQSIIGRTITMKSPCWSDVHLDPETYMEYPDWIENAYELLDQPGEWYYDKTAGVIYYIPRSGETITTVEIIAPIIEKLISLEGQTSTPVHHLKFEGLTFSNTTWLTPNTAKGHPDFFANVAMRGTDYGVYTEKAAASVYAKYTTNVAFVRNTFTKLGGDGLGIEHGSKDIQIVGNNLYDISGNGMQLGDLDNPYTTDDKEITRNFSINNNYIHHIGTEYYSGVGISVGLVQNFVINHNEIHDTPSSGITIGWHTDDPQKVAKNNTIAYNAIRDVMKIMYDGGGMYSANNQPGNVYSYNVIRNQRNDHGGLYLDIDSENIELSNNISVDNARNAFVNGGNNYIHDNWWQDRFDEDVWFYQNNGKADRVENNRIIWDISDTPSSIRDIAGIEATYIDIKNAFNGDTTLPTVQLTNPLKESTIPRHVEIRISANAQDENGIEKIEFLLNSMPLCTDTIAPYSCPFVTDSPSGTPYVFTAKATDKNGNSNYHSINVLVQ